MGSDPFYSVVGTPPARPLALKENQAMHKLNTLLTLGTTLISINAMAASTSLRLINNSTQMTEFQIFQGINPVARLGVAAGASAAVPTTESYQVTAATLTGQKVLKSNRVNFDGSSQTVRAQVALKNGCQRLELVASPGITPGTISLENTWDQPVQFKLSRPNSPFQIVTVVDSFNTLEFSPPPPVFTVLAAAPGSDMVAASVTNPNATITEVENSNGPGGISLIVGN